MKLRILLLCVILTPMMANAEIYKWKDKDGRVRYSDIPPPSNIKQESLYGKKIPKPTGQQPLSPVEGETGAAIDRANEKVSSDKVPMSKEEAAEKRAKDAEQEKLKSEVKKEEDLAKAENCKAAQANLLTYNQGGRIVKANEQGEREYLTDADIVKGRSEAQAAVDKYCS